MYAMILAELQTNPVIMVVKFDSLQVCHNVRERQLTLLSVCFVFQRACESSTETEIDYHQIRDADWSIQIFF